ncbi:MAG: GAF domain-containing sensor histidine kinase [Armatimonadetes bacterium]|nr:GAF domain-containing sensor histidine kinase [Armatimonadota bacterium]MDE2205120.1 GAF domain-containing sensor histidine kinase [Armatimonadota bacterium]
MKNDSLVMPDVNGPVVPSARDPLMLDDATLESAPFCAVVVHAKDYRIARVNRAAAALARRVLGIDHLEGQPLRVLAPDMEEALLGVLAECIRTRSPMRMQRIEYRSPRGRKYFLDWSLLPLIDSTGEVDRLFIIAIDMTVRETAKAQSAALEALRTRSMVEAVSQAICSTLDPDELVHRVFAELQAIGAFLRISIFRPTVRNHEWRLSAAWSAVDSPLWPEVGHTYLWPDLFQMETRISDCLSYRPDVAGDGLLLSPVLTELGVGSSLSVKLRSQNRTLGVLNLMRTEQDAFPARERALFEALGPYLATALHNCDVYRSLKDAHGAVVRAEAWRAIGELASGMAHNLNNLLAAILGYTELIRDEAPDADAVRRDATIIERAALDGAEIVGRVQRFARSSQSAQREVTGLGRLIADALTLTRPSWDRANGATITVAEALPKDVEVLVSHAELREVLVNLIRNACDAMPGGGTLSVRCFQHGGEAIAEIIDTGTGIEPETKTRLFEPFFTTKGSEHGLGLGLSISWNVVHQHGGSMEVESTAGHGATFRVRLPLAGPAAPASLPVFDAAPEIGTVALIDADAEDRAAIARLLQESGGAVHEFDTGGRAQAWLRTNAGRRCTAIVSAIGTHSPVQCRVLERIHDKYPQMRLVMIRNSDAAPAMPVSAHCTVLSRPVIGENLRSALQPAADPH